MKSDNQKIADDWLKFLDPHQTRNALQTAGLFLVAFEILKQAIVDEIGQSFSLELDESGVWVPSPDYTREVLEKHKGKDVVLASCLWLKDEGVISESDIEKFREIRQHRNDVAHELLKYLSSSDHTINTLLFADMCGLLAKIDRWWIINFHVPANPSFDGKEVDGTRVQSGRMMALGLIMQVLSGKDEVVGAMRTVFQKHGSPSTEPNAPPNGGPAEPLGNSGVNEGPPSVS